MYPRHLPTEASTTPQTYMSEAKRVFGGSCLAQDTVYHDVESGPWSMVPSAIVGDGRDNRFLRQSCDGCSYSYCWRLTSLEEHCERACPTSRVCVCRRPIQGGRVLVGTFSPPDAWKVRSERESIPRWKPWSSSSATAVCFILTSAPSVLLNWSSRR